MSRIFHHNSIHYRRLSHLSDYYFQLNTSEEPSTLIISFLFSCVFMFTYQPSSPFVLLTEMTPTSALYRFFLFDFCFYVTSHEHCAIESWFSWLFQHPRIFFSYSSSKLWLCGHSMGFGFYIMLLAFTQFNVTDSILY